MSAVAPRYAVADLEDAVERLKHARSEFASIDAEVTAGMEEWEESHRDLLDARSTARKMLTAMEEHAREVALATWLEGDQESKTLRPGIGIRETTEVVYDKDMAFEWARASGYCLTLDSRRFERLAVEDIAGVLPQGLAKVEKRATVTIAKVLP